jgi:hypothetical protein
MGGKLLKGKGAIHTTHLGELHRRPDDAAVRWRPVAHTCTYDTWAAYDERGVGTQLQGALRRPVFERTLANKEQAISDAYRALVDVLSVDTNSVYIPQMKQPEATRI